MPSKSYPRRQLLDGEAVLLADQTRTESGRDGTTEPTEVHPCSDQRIRRMVEGGSQHAGLHGCFAGIRLSRLSYVERTRERYEEFWRQNVSPPGDRAPRLSERGSRS